MLEPILPRGFVHEPTSKGYLNTKGREGEAQTRKNSQSCSWDAEAAPKLGEIGIISGSWRLGWDHAGGLIQKIPVFCWPCV